MKLLGISLGILIGLSTAGAATLTANPLICEIPTGQSLCTSTISWNATEAKDVQVRIEGNLFAAAQSGSSAAPWISETPAKFELWGDGKLLQTLTVVGVKASSGPTGKITASPSTCVIDPAQGTCSVTISWSTVKAVDVKVKISGLLFAAGLSGTSVAPWITTQPGTFELWGDGKLLDSVTVVGATSVTPKPEPIIIDPNHCQASDQTTLQKCFAGLLAHKYTGIALMNDITCTNPEACVMHFNGFTGPVKIYGATAGKNTVLKRKAGFGKAVVGIYNSTDIEFKDIDFSEGDLNKPAGLFKTAGYDRNLSCDVPQEQCASAISVTFDSARVNFDHISILESKSQGIEFGNVTDVSIKNSVIKHAWANGLWTTNGWMTGVPNAHVPVNIKIQNNSFVDNRCSGIEMSAAGDSVVSGNYLSHNHMGSIYHVPGGQLAVEANTTSLLIKDNEITNGRIDEDSVLASQGWTTVALEFTDSHVHGVTVEHNYVHDNSGGGMIHDPNPSGPRLDFGPIKAQYNVFKNPKPDFMNWDAGELISIGNCSGAACVYEP